MIRLFRTRPADALMVAFATFFVGCGIIPVLLSAFDSSIRFRTTSWYVAIVFGGYCGLLSAMAWWLTLFAIFINRSVRARIVLTALVPMIGCLGFYVGSRFAVTCSLSPIVGFNVVVIAIWTIVSVFALQMGSINAVKGRVIDLREVPVQARKKRKFLHLALGVAALLFSIQIGGQFMGAEFTHEQAVLFAVAIAIALVLGGIPAWILALKRTSTVRVLCFSVWFGLIIAGLVGAVTGTRFLAYLGRGPLAFVGSFYLTLLLLMASARWFGWRFSGGVTYDRQGLFAERGATTRAVSTHPLDHDEDEVVVPTGSAKPDLPSQDSNTNEPTPTSNNSLRPSMVVAIASLLFTTISFWFMHEFSVEMLVFMNNSGRWQIAKLVARKHAIEIAKEEVSQQPRLGQFRKPLATYFDTELASIDLSGLTPTKRQWNALRKFPPVDSIAIGPKTLDAGGALEMSTLPRLMAVSVNSSESIRLSDASEAFANPALESVFLEGEPTCQLVEVALANGRRVSTSLSHFPPRIEKRLRYQYGTRLYDPAGFAWRKELDELTQTLEKFNGDWEKSFVEVAFRVDRNSEGKVIGLDLSSHPLSTEQLLQLACFPELEWLAVTVSSVDGENHSSQDLTQTSSMSDSNVIRFPLLKHLRLEFCGTPAADANEFLIKAFPNLETLEITDYPWMLQTDEDCSFFESLPARANLKRLAIFFDEIDGDEFNVLRSMTQLSELRIGYLGNGLLVHRRYCVPNSSLTQETFDRSIITVFMPVTAIPHSVDKDGWPCYPETKPDWNAFSDQTKQPIQQETEDSATVPK
jgi:hypothetical protein